MRTAHTGMTMAAGISGSYAYFTWSEDGGATWQTPIQISPEKVADEQPGLTEGFGGSIYVAVTMAGAVRVLRSQLGGAAGSWQIVGVLQ